MNKEFVENIIESIKLNANEKNLDINVVKDIFLDSIKKVYVKKFSLENLKLDIDLNKKKFSSFRELKVVEDLDDPLAEIQINDSRIKGLNLVENDVYDESFSIQEQFNRIEVQNILQIFKHSINQVINSDIIKEWGSRKGDIVFAEVESINSNGSVIVNLSNIYGSKEIYGFLPLKEQSPKDKFIEGEKYHFVIKNVIESTKFWPIVLSRASNDLVRYYMTNEIPEIQNESIIIKYIGRYPGYRTKVVVEAKHKSIKEPVAICIGSQGARIKEISKLIGGEKIDVYRYFEDFETQVVALFYNPETPKMSIAFKKDKIGNIHTAIIYVPNYELAKVLGSKGCNVKIVSEILGIRIEVREDDYINVDGLNPKLFSSFDLSYKQNNELFIEQQKTKSQNIKPILEEDDIENFHISTDEFTNEEFAEDINIFFDDKNEKK